MLQRVQDKIRNEPWYAAALGRDSESDGAFCSSVECDLTVSVRCSARCDCGLSSVSGGGGGCYDGGDDPVAHLWTPIFCDRSAKANARRRMFVSGLQHRPRASIRGRFQMKDTDTGRGLERHVFGGHGECPSLSTEQNQGNTEARAWP
jgi:hypothetical protein